MYQVGENGVAISDSIHRALNDMVLRITDGHVSGWEDNYKIFIGSEGDVTGEPIKKGRSGFQSGFTQKIAFLPTPEWVRDSSQRVCICFTYELSRMMEDWWKKYARHLR